jgi:hypothetical protein
MIFNLDRQKYLLGRSVFQSKFICYEWQIFITLLKSIFDWVKKFIWAYSRKKIKKYKSNCDQWMKNYWKGDHSTILTIKSWTFCVNYFHFFSQYFNKRTFIWSIRIVIESYHIENIPINRRSVSKCQKILL